MNCMLNLTAIKLPNNLRLFHTSSGLPGIAKVMKKVLNKGVEKKKSKYYDTPMPSMPSEFSKSHVDKRQPVNSKRTNVLNKLFMRYITDLMSTGESSMYFVGHGIEISRVKISPDFSSVNIYWIARGTEKDNVIEEILNTHVGSLRHELAQLKVVGVIPQFMFVKDKTYALTAELDRLLAVADFGEDYEPLDLASRLTTQLELNSRLDSNTVDKIKTLDDNEETEYEQPIPPMPHTIFNLNHSEMLERILKSKKKSPPPLSLDYDVHKMATSINENIIRFSSDKEERDAFKEFLRKRQILIDKSLKAERQYNPDFEYLQEERYEKGKQQYNDVENTFEENDYIEDELNEK